MKVVIFGSSGMVGHGVLRACVLDEGVSSVLLVSRRPTGPHPAKVTEIVHDDFTDFSAIEDELAGADACFYCLGVSSAGRSEAEYTRITYDYTLAAAHSLVRVSPGLVFIYVSGEGTDSEQKARAAWARIKGRTENDLAALNLRAHMFRPGYIQPRHGARSRTPLYRLLYAATSWLYPVLHKLAPAHTTTTAHIAQAMLTVARTPTESPRVLTSAQINTLATKTPPPSAP